MLPYREQMGARLWSDSDNDKQVIVQHTTESEGGNTNVINYLENSRAGSYQTMIDFDGEEVRLVPDNRQAWAAMATGNKIGLHACAMGRANYSRDKWMSYNDLIERTAIRYAEWHKKYGIPLVKISARDVANGVRGICGHVDISNAFRESDHSDPGNNFPYDIVIERATALVNGVIPMARSLVDGKELTMEQLAQYADYHAWRTDKIVTELGRRAGLDTSDEALKRLK